MSADVFQYTPQELAEMDPRDALLSQIRDGSWLDAQEFPPLEWAVDGLIPEGFGLITGPPKLGKSWFVLGVLLAISAGGRAVGRIHVDPKPVLYLALEDGDRRMQSRVRVLNGDDPTPPRFQFLTTAEPSTVIQTIEAWLSLHPGGIVALDTLGKVMPQALPGEGAYQRDYRVGGTLKRLTDTYPGSTLMVVHHVRKQGSGDWMDSTSGTNGLNGSADWTLNLERARSAGEAIIRVTGRDVREGEYSATFDGDTWGLAGEDLDQSAQIARMTTKQQGLGDDSATILDFIDEHPDGVKTKQVAEHMDWAENKTRTYLSRLHETGRIEKAGRGLYTPVASVASVAFEDEDATPSLSLATESVALLQDSDQEEHTKATDATVATQEVQP